MAADADKDGDITRAELDISDWNLTLTSAVQTFAWNTITDVVFHLRYTAREGGDLLRAAAC